MAPIHDAAGRGDLENVMRLVQEDPGILVSPDDDRGRTPLHFAASNGRLEVACYLLDRGADIHTKDERGGTALWLACHSGHVGMVELLVSRGADPTKTNSVGDTLLIEAAVQGHVEAVRYLLRVRAVRAIIDTQSWQKKTALLWAALRGQVSCEAASRGRSQSFVGQQ